MIDTEGGNIVKFIAAPLPPPQVPPALPIFQQLMFLNFPDSVSISECFFFLPRAFLSACVAGAVVIRGYPY